MSCDTPLTIIYQDDDLVAVDKPPGLPVHRSRQHPGDSVLLQRLRDQIGRWVWPVHRLDPPTSGLIVFALHPAAAKALAAQFRRREVEKRYLAVVRGWPPEQGRVEHALRRPGRSERQAAVTDYRRLAWTEIPVPMPPHPTARYALVALRPITGRRHQLRRHLKHISHPIIGDTTYGKGPHNRLFRERFHSNELLLRSTGLALRHPGTDEPLRLECALSGRWQSVLAATGLAVPGD